MNRLIGSWLLASLALTIHAQPAETGLKIAVHIYNYAGATPETLLRAERETAKIYERAGIAMAWLICPLSPEELAQNTACDVPAQPTRLTLRLLSNEMAQRFPVGGDIFGFALLPVYGGFGVVANIFADRARDITSDQELQRVILGHLIAHELGHLLLGEAGHPAGAGIMHVPWQTKELERIKQAPMFFLPEQAETIRAQVLARTISRGEASGQTDRDTTTNLQVHVRNLAKVPVHLPSDAPPPDVGLQIEMHIYNYSQVPHEMLVRAEQASARIFERIGIATIWLDCPLTSHEAVRNRACALPDAPTKLTLRLLSNSMADSLGVGGEIFGSALLPADEGFGVVANVYADRTRELADGRDCEVILGRVIAHELGHLLLGQNAHSAAGLMQARWRAQDLGLSRQAAMLFLPGEAKRIRAEVRARAGQRP